MDWSTLPGYILLLAGGGVLSVYLYKSNIKAAGRFLGVSSLVLGVFGLISFSVGLDGTTYEAIWITFGFSVLGMCYIEFRKAKAVLAIGAPFYGLILTYVLSLPLLVLFAALALEVGMLDAWSISRSGMRSVDGRLLAPLSIVGLVISRLLRGSSSNAVLFLSYSILPLVVVLLVLPVWFLAGATVAYIFIVMIGAYLALASIRLTNRWKSR